MDTHRSVLFRDAGETEYLFMSYQQNARQPHQSFKSVQNEREERPRCFQRVRWPLSAGWPWGALKLLCVTPSVAIRCVPSITNLVMFMLRFNQMEHNAIVWRHTQINNCTAAQNTSIFNWTISVTGHKPLAAWILVPASPVRRSNVISWVCNSIW